MSVDADRVRARLVAMTALLDHLDALGEVTATRLEEDFAIRLQVERVLSQVVTLATEINTHVVSREAGRAPSDLRSSFGDLAAVGWIDRSLATELRGSSGLRNVLVHEYVDVDLDVVALAVPLALDAYRRFIRQVAAKL
ncbi:MAG: DUF86 domain-containing protein [Mobilicoccus sp.]|nr:DUF86 domain-containing protein [Mobilicoccus sp.]